MKSSGSLSSIVLSDNDADTTDTTVNYTYDSLQRVHTVSNGVFTSTYSYHDDTTAGKASPQLESIVHEGVNYGGKTIECNYTYEYDVNGNITSAAFGSRVNTYAYDANNQLIRENNDRHQYTQVWEYDAFGNITETRKYAYTIGELGEPTSTVTYGYTNSDWGDLLTEYNGQSIDYDNIGNPVSVTDAQGNVVKSYTWTMGRQMASYTNNGVTWTYTYDADGMRTRRTDGTNTYEYIYAGDKLIRMVYNGTVVDFGYAGGQLATLTYDGTTYYYVLNGQGDVVALTDSTGRAVIAYHYSAYGEATVLRADETLTPILKNLNPFLYRGYVYDIGASYYYLQSRYYDPKMGRFINADAYASTGQGILGNNMFAYCLNNPVVLVDTSGNAAHISFSADGQPHYAPWKIGSPGGGGWPQGIHYSRQDYGSVADKFLTVRALKFILNTDEQVVLEAEHFAFYKGCLVIRTNGNRSGSFGVLFITRETNTRDYPEDIIRHEYGHTVQLAQLGVVKYALCIGLPSLFEWGSDQEYYRRPWEITADIYGGVQSRYYPGYEAAGFEYLLISKLCGIGAWLTID